MKTTIGKIMEYRKRCNVRRKLERIKIDEILAELTDDDFPIVIDDTYKIIKIR